MPLNFPSKLHFTPLKDFAFGNYIRDLKCYYDQKYKFFVLSIFQKYKHVLLTVQSFKSKFVREVRLF